ncbi:hypothetical protein B0H10DRAFT_401699 [Mycena sp. CBHHK59/15]|nr:hypothetical protein B0H10DRAFT_401699 [Mycena sp. CBHHK59/15]
MNPLLSLFRRKPKRPAEAEQPGIPTASSLGQRSTVLSVPSYSLSVPNISSHAPDAIHRPRSAHGSPTPNVTHAGTGATPIAGSPVLSAGDDPAAVHSSETAMKTTVWNLFRDTLNLLKETTDLCLPLKTVVSGLNFVLEKYDKIQDHQGELRQIVERMKNLADIIQKYNRTESTEEMRVRIEKMTSVIEAQERVIQSTLQKGKVDRTLNERLIAQRIIESLKAISNLLDAFQVSLFELLCCEMLKRREA